MNLESVELQTPKGKIHFKYRKDSVGDSGVIEQIFANQDYNFQRWQEHASRLNSYAATQRNEGHSLLIIDAGANIGAASVYFQHAFEQAKIIAIEPEANNFNLLDLNTASYANQHNLNYAISNFDGEIELEDPGHSDWGFRTKAVSDSTPSTKKVKCISPQTLIAQYASASVVPLVFKIDIEGAEDKLFEGDISWMDQFPLLIIELHDWMLPFKGSSKSFFNALVQYDFDFLFHGENVFLFNKRMLVS